MMAPWWWFPEAMAQIERWAAENEWELERDRRGGGSLLRRCDACHLGLDRGCACELIQLGIDDELTLGQLHARLRQPRPGR